MNAFAFHYSSQHVTSTWSVGLDSTDKAYFLDWDRSRSIGIGVHPHLTLTCDFETSGDELSVGLELTALTGQLERVGKWGEEGAGEGIA